jgi:hypothetical protein
MLITEQALFKMPQDKELQFPAMAVLKSYVSTYKEKMAANDVSQGTATYRLFYELEMAKEDYTFFRLAGIKLSDPPRRIEQPDMVFDLTEDRIHSMAGSGKHACQIYGIITGVACPPWPQLRQLKLKTTGTCAWGVAEDSLELTSCMEQLADKVVPVDCNQLIMAEENKWTGIVGQASQLTYLACAMGIPTIEILPEGRDVGFLSKFGFKLYRVIEHRDNLERKVLQAMKNIRDVCHYLATKEMYAQSQKAAV